MSLEVRNLHVAFEGGAGERAEAVRGVDLDLPRGETLGIVGESGAGKSALALAIIGLLPRRARTSGEIRLDGEDLLTMTEGQRDRTRGRRIGMIFQEPMTALNPAMRVGAQIAEGIRVVRGMPARDARMEALRLLDRVRIPQARARMSSFPHELSGGQRQRVGIAIAIALRPDILIADEPTTALDVTVQAEILDILDDLVADTGMALLFVSHDLGVIARISDRVLVMRHGMVMETGVTEAVLRHPSHDYTRELISSLPRRTRATLGAGDG